MAEQKEKMNIEIHGNTYVIDPKNIALRHDVNGMQWKFYPKIGTLGIEGWRRLIDFMESIGFLCEDNPNKFEVRIFPKKGDGYQPDESVYILAIGACLCLGHPCVRKGREIIAEYF